jgi:hypothetical protein
MTAKGRTLNWVPQGSGALFFLILFFRGRKGFYS